MNTTKTNPGKLPVSALRQCIGECEPARILVADDELGVRRLFVYVLKKAGYDVDVVDDGQAAWEALAKKNYDLLVTDNNMPRLSGLDLIKKLRTSHVAIPVIMASGTFYTEAIEANESVSFVTLLSKPVSISTLLSHVSRLLNSTAKKQKRQPTK
jgi:DNA-binding NtrC family response regulator